MLTNNKTIRVLVVEDNRVVQEYLKAAILEDPKNQIVGVASDGLEALDMVATLKPDIMLLDIFMPGMDGIELTKHVMSSHACPIVVISGELESGDRNLSFEALRAGAVDVMEKPQGMEAEDYKRFSDELCRNVRLMSQVKVTRRWTDKPGKISPATINISYQQKGIDLLLIGASTGGPAAIYKILSSIPAPAPYPILIGQHIASGFSSNLGEWLAKTGHKVLIPENEHTMQAGEVYLSEDLKHLCMGKDKKLYQTEDNTHFFSPNINLLFSSALEHFEGHICALLLTGMGNDGASSMKSLFEAGAMTIAEAEESAVVFGMPKVAIENGAARMVLNLDEICKLFAGQE